MNPNDTQPQLDPAVTAKLKEVLEKDPSSLTLDDKFFLQARKSYLGRSSRQKFQAALDEDLHAEKSAEEEEEKQAEQNHPAENQDDGEDE